jgi:hypothetical protein
MKFDYNIYSYTHHFLIIVCIIIYISIPCYIKCTIPFLSKIYSLLNWILRLFYEFTFLENQLSKALNEQTTMRNMGVIYEKVASKKGLTTDKRNQRGRVRPYSCDAFMSYARMRPKVSHHRLFKYVRSRLIRGMECMKP